MLSGDLGLGAGVSPPRPTPTSAVIETPVEDGLELSSMRDMAFVDGGSEFECGSKVKACKHWSRETSRIRLIAATCRQRRKGGEVSGCLSCRGM